MSNDRLVLVILMLVMTVTATAQTTDQLGSQLVEDAAWCWFSDPRAVYHKGERERIYYG